MHRLVANLSYAELTPPGSSPITLHLSALVIEESRDNITDLDQYFIRGLVTSKGWEIFSYELGCYYLNYAVDSCSSGKVVATGRDPLEQLPLETVSTILRFDDGTQLYVASEDRQQPIDMTDHEDMEQLREYLATRIGQLNTREFPRPHRVPHVLSV